MYHDMYRVSIQIRYYTYRILMLIKACNPTYVGICIYTYMSSGLYELSLSHSLEDDSVQADDIWSEYKFQ